MWPRTVSSGGPQPASAIGRQPAFPGAQHRVEVVIADLFGSHPFVTLQELRVPARPPDLSEDQHRGGGRRGQLLIEGWSP
ncbi:hypothetical protein ACFWBC_05155 [Streptomyces sp. NPDC059985]|uniref:hypothetical protein n=1 Tax=Streptomyces sp. NPDC059985 TaxID=3347025 RepID=UPI00368567E1